MKLLILPFVTFAVYWTIIDGATTKSRTRSGKPLGSFNKEERQSLSQPDVTKTELVLPEPLRILVEKVEALLAKGKDISLDDLTSEITALLSEAESSIAKSNNTREARGLLDKLSFLTGLHLGSLFHGSGTLAATQSLTFLGRIINSALSLSYGPTGSIIPSVLPAIPLADELPQNSPTDPADVDDTRIIYPTNFLFDHNRRVEEINRQRNTTGGSFRQGRRN